MRLKVWAWHSFLATLFPLDSQTGMRELSQRTSFFFFFLPFPRPKSRPPSPPPFLYSFFPPSSCVSWRLPSHFTIQRMFLFFLLYFFICVYVSAQQFQLRRKNVDNSFESRTISDWTTQFRLVTKKTRKRSWTEPWKEFVTTTTTTTTTTKKTSELDEE